MCVKRKQFFPCLQGRTCTGLYLRYTVYVYNVCTLVCTYIHAYEHNICISDSSFFSFSPLTRLTLTLLCSAFSSYNLLTALCSEAPTRSLSRQSSEKLSLSTCRGSTSTRRQHREDQASHRYPTNPKDDANTWR